MHMSDGEGPITRRQHRKPSRKAEGGAASADDISSQASASSLTKRQRLKVGQLRCCETPGIATCVVWLAFSELQHAGGRFWGVSEGQDMCSQYCCWHAAVL
jgi:hypothetical protein